MTGTDVTASIVVGFPLRGEWVAVNTPAQRVPSHGVDMLGQRYAYDFLRIDPAAGGFKFFRGSTLHYLAFGVTLQDCYGWSAPIHAPFDGTVVDASDGWPERQRVHLLSDLAVVGKHALFFDAAKTDLRSVLGNHIIIQMQNQDVFGFIAHARCGSVRVRKGARVRLGEQIAEVGHSGNSTAPHLHFHLMDRASIVDAQGLPCSFTGYETRTDSGWTPVAGGMPGKRELIRSAA